MKTWICLLFIGTTFTCKAQYQGILSAGPLYSTLYSDVVEGIHPVAGYCVTWGNLLGDGFVRFSQNLTYHYLGAGFDFYDPAQNMELAKTQNMHWSTLTEQAGIAFDVSDETSYPYIILNLGYQFHGDRDYDNNSASLEGLVVKAKYQDLSYYELSNEIKQKYTLGFNTGYMFSMDYFLLDVGIHADLINNTFGNLTTPFSSFRPVYLTAKFGLLYGG